MNHIADAVVNGLVALEMSVAKDVIHPDSAIGLMNSIVVPLQSASPSELAEIERAVERRKLHAADDVEISLLRDFFQAFGLPKPTNSP